MNETKKDGVETITINLQPFLMPVAVLLSAIVFSVSFLIGTNNIADSVKEGGTKSTTVAANNNDDVADVADPTEEEANPSTSVSIDNDAYLGNKDDAKVAIVEFTDFECPYCQRHHQETYPSIIQDYVDSGKAIYVIRDYPLSFHGQVAIDEAIGAECVKAQKGNEAYFKFIDKVIENTGTNGSGVTGGNDTLAQYAEEVGANKSEFRTCLENKTYQDDLDQDQSDGTTAGINGTPGFVIGVLDNDGNVDGVLVSGALPYASFQTIIDEQLDRAD